MEIQLCVESHEVCDVLRPGTGLLSVDKLSVEPSYLELG